MHRTVLPLLATILRNVFRDKHEELAEERAKDVVRLRPFLLERARLAGRDGGALERRLDAMASAGGGLAPNTPAWRDNFGDR